MAAVNITSAGPSAEAGALGVVPTEAVPEATEAPTETAPARVVAISDLGASLTACEDASESGAWNSCIGKELEARGYQVEAERAGTEAAEPEAKAPKAVK